MKKLLNRGLKILLVTNALVLIAGALFGPLYAVFVEEIGGDILDAGITIGIYSFVAGVTTLFAGRYADKFRRGELVVVGGYILMGIGFLMYTVVESVWFLFIVQIVIGFGEAIYAPAFDALYSKHLSPGKEASEWGMWEAMNYFIIALGAVIGSFILILTSFDLIFILMAILCFGSAIYIYFLPKRTL